MQNTSGYEDLKDEQGVPTLISWTYDGKEIAVEGSWDNWKSRFFMLDFIHPHFTLKKIVLNFLSFKIASWLGKIKTLFLRNLLQRSGKDFTILKVLPSGVYQYRFIVDGQWRCSPDLPCVQDEAGNTYNILDVKVHLSSQNYLSPFSLKNSIEFQA